MTPKQREKKLELYRLLAKQEAELVRKNEELKKQDPFWWFIPTDGKIPPAKREVLAKYIKPEHIPERVDCQLDVLLNHSGIKGVSGGNRAGKTVVDTIDGIIKSTGELPHSLQPYKEQFQPIIDRTKGKIVRGRVVAIDYKQLYRVPVESWKKWVPRPARAFLFARGADIF